MPLLPSSRRMRARAGILAVICAKLRGCIFSPAFWDCIPRIASNFCPSSFTGWQFCPWRWCGDDGAYVYIHVYIYTHPFFEQACCSHVDFLKRNEKNEAFFLVWWTLGGGKWSGKRNKFFLKKGGEVGVDPIAIMDYVLFWNARDIVIDDLDPILSGWNSFFFFSVAIIYFFWDRYLWQRKKEMMIFHVVKIWSK